MEIVKKNLISIICGVVALAAIVSAFYPLGGMWSTLQSNAQSRAGVFTEVKNLMNKDRTLPVVNASGGEAQKLQLNSQPLFPNPNVIEAAKTQLGIVKDNSDKFLQAAVPASENQAACGRQHFRATIQTPPVGEPNSETAIEPRWTALLHRLLDPCPGSYSKPVAHPPRTMSTARQRKFARKSNRRCFRKAPTGRN